MSIESVAYDALNLARENKRDITAHEDLCAERYNHIGQQMSEIKSFLKWFGGTSIIIIIGLLGFLSRAQIDANNQAQRAAIDKIERLEQQMPRRP